MENKIQNKSLFLEIKDKKEKLINIIDYLNKEKFLLGIKIDLTKNIISLEDLFNLKEILEEKNIPLFMKIGGCEAENDIFNAKKLSVNSISVPMIETPYSLIKFVNSVNKFLPKEKRDTKLFVNIETKCGLENIDKILSTKESDEIAGIILGRDDMSDSLGLNESFVNSKILFDIAVKMSKIAEKNNKQFSIGGKIRPEAISFLKKLGENHITKVETRMVVFDAKKLIFSTKMREFILKAMEFEMEWIKYTHFLKGFDYVNL